MFMVRAIFWLTVVALLMPREPDVGLGRPDAGSGFSGTVAMADSAADVATGTAVRASDCKQYRSACETGLELVDQFQTAALLGLARVKAELEHQKRVRGQL